GGADGGRIDRPRWSVRRERDRDRGGGDRPRPGLAVTRRGAGRSPAAGFTLVEVLAAVLVAGVMAATGALLLVTGTDLSRAAAVRERLVSDGERALERMRRDVRRLRGGTALDVFTTLPTELSFADASGATVTWRKQGSTLERNGAAAADGV